MFVINVRGTHRRSAGESLLKGVCVAAFSAFNRLDWNSGRSLRHLGDRRRNTTDRTRLVSGLQQHIGTALLFNGTAFRHLATELIHAEEDSLGHAVDLVLVDDYFRVRQPYGRHAGDTVTVALLLLM